MEKIKELRKKIINLNLDGYIVPKNDEFFSEYTPNYKDTLRHITNFTGSYGLAIILKNKNYLLVDGRYTLQAKKQSGDNFKIITIPTKNLNKQLKTKNMNIGFNPKLFNNNVIKKLKHVLNCNLIPSTKNIFKNLSNNYKVKKNLFYFLKNSVTGQSTPSKIKKLTGHLNKKKLDMCLVTTQENVAWLLNMRGADSDFSPIPNSNLILDKKNKIFLFCDLNKVKKNFRKKVKNLKIMNIKYIDRFLMSIQKKNFLIDNLTCSVYLQNLVRKKNFIKDTLDPIYKYKSIKNKVEIKNTKKIHEYDGAALTKFLYWVKNNYKKRIITEIIAQNKLLEFRKKFKKFKFLSFPTISSTGPNGAIVHYKATQNTNKILKNGNLYLVDSGGQYHYGTTDVTRTISLGNKDKRIKEIFTRVLKGHLHVSNYNLKGKTTGSKIDKIARKFLKEINIDYSHGTGHGVGYFLNVHEGPQSISRLNKIKLRPGMILSNEPGYYEEGSFGIRIENLITIVKKKNKNIFQNLTYAPIDRNLIEKKLMSSKEIHWLNNYHKEVYQKLKRYMNKNELIFLRESCSNI